MKNDVMLSSKWWLASPNVLLLKYVNMGHHIVMMSRQNFSEEYFYKILHTNNIYSKTFFTLPEVNKYVFNQWHPQKLLTSLTNYKHRNCQILKKSHQLRSSHSQKVIIFSQILSVAEFLYGGVPQTWKIKEMQTLLEPRKEQHIFFYKRRIWSLEKQVEHDYIIKDISW